MIKKIAICLSIFWVVMACNDDKDSDSNTENGVDGGSDASIDDMSSTSSTTSEIDGGDPLDTGDAVNTNQTSDTGDVQSTNSQATDVTSDTVDTGDQSSLPERTPLDTTVLAGTWHKDTANGAVDLVLGADMTASRVSTDTAISSFENGSWLLDSEKIVLSYASATANIQETFSAALVETLLYERVLVRAPGGDDSLNGSWSGEWGWRSESLSDASSFEQTLQSYSIQFNGEQFMYRDAYYEAVPFGPNIQELDDNYNGRGTVLVQSQVVQLTYTEYTNESTGLPVELPPPISIGRRIAMGVIFKAGGADPAMDEVFSKVE